MLRALGRGIRSVLQRAAVALRAPHPAPRHVGAVPALVPSLRVVLSDLSRRGPPSLVDAGL
jgi:hypothetical protein